MSREGQAESECDLKKQSQFVGVLMNLRSFGARDYERTPAFGHDKTKPIAGLWPEIRSTKLDKSGAFAGCLLPGVVPEIRNKDALQSTFEKTKPICRGANERKVFSNNEIWRFPRYEIAERQSQSKPNAGFWSETRST
jgi:hypothetical protein